MISQRGLLLVLSIVLCSLGFLQVSHGLACEDHWDCKKCDKIKREGKCNSHLAVCYKTCKGCAPYADKPYTPCADIKKRGDCFKPQGAYKPELYAMICAKTCCVLDTPPKWTHWTKWSSCSKTCHYGIKSRSRTCVGEGFGQTCSGAGLETAKCNENVKCQGTIVWDKTSVTVDECAKTVTVSITRARVTNCKASITINTKDGSAKQPADYGQIKDHVIKFDKGETKKSVTFKIIGDTIPEGVENFSATITANPEKLEVLKPKCTINIKDQSATIGFEPKTYTVTENDGSVKVKVVRKGDKSRKITCSVSSADGSAKAPADYEAASKVPVVFNAGDDSKVVSIKIEDDKLQESDETFKVLLTCEKSPCTKVEPGQATVTIKSDDVNGGYSTWTPFGKCTKTCGGGTQSRTRTCTNPAPQGEGKKCEGKAKENRDCNTHHCPGYVGWEKTEVTVGECGGSVTVKILRSVTTNIKASLKVTTKSGITLEVDGKVSNGAITFEPGQTSKAVTFKPKADSTIEPDETFQAVITSDNAADLIVTPGKGTCTIKVKDQSALIGFDKSEYIASENDGSVKVTVVRSGNKNGENKCTVTSQDGSAKASKGDYKAVNAEIVFKAGQTSQVVEVSVEDDSEQESTEDLKLSLKCEKPECVKVKSSVVKITDDDINGGFSNWTPFGKCTKTCGPGTQSRSRTCTNPAPKGEGKKCVGATTNTRTCNIHPCPIDGNWTIWTTWSKGSRSCGGAVQYRSRTCSNPKPLYGGKYCQGYKKETRACNPQPCPAKVGLKPIMQTVPESVGKVKVTVFRVGNSIGYNKVHVSTVPKTAKFPSDFENIPETEIIFKPGESYKVVIINIVNDNIPENDEEFELRLKSNDKGVVQVKPDTSTIKIVDDDVTLGLKPTKLSVRESAGTITLTVFRNGNRRGETNAVINTCDQSAKAPGDYIALKDLKLKFAAGEKSKSFKVNIVNDKLVEKIEDFCVKLSSPDKDVRAIKPEKAVVSIVDDDVKLGIYSDQKVLESVSSVKLRVNRYGNLKQSTKAIINTEDGTAKAGSDYHPRKNFAVNFAPGESVKYFKVFIKNDNIPESVENFRVKLSSPDKEVTVIKPEVSKVTILDDDAKVGFEKIKYFFDETAGTVKVALVRSGATHLEHTVTVKSNDNTAKAPGDYDNVHQKITFKKDQKRVEISINIKNDGIEEGRETFKLVLTTTDNRVLLDPSVTSICIVDNDVDGKWGPWTSWSDCGKSCGYSTQSRSRKCDNPAPKGEGKACVGKDKESRKCYKIQHCPVSGGWSKWSAWGKCSKPCGKGYRLRTRICNNPKPVYGGLPCIGTPQQLEYCNKHCCKVNGGWSAWTKWTPCSVTCYNNKDKDFGIRSRTRKCDSPKPACGGATCAGGYAAYSQREKCSPPTQCNAYVVQPIANPYGK